jgi:SPP1 gp7 family putative phage head morphogenesis protein
MRATHQALLRRMQEEELRITAMGVVATRAAAAAVKAKALAAYVSGNPIVVRAMLAQDMLPDLLAAIVAMHVSGEKLSRDAARGELALSRNGINAILKRLASPERQRLLRRRYETSVFRVLDDAGQKVERTLRATVNELIAEGAPTKKGVQVLAAKFDDLGLTPKNSYQVETIFRTQSQIAYNAGRWEADQDPDIQSILWGYTYSTVGDDRVRPAHAALDGTALPKDDPFWKRFWPPNGWGCRCTPLPVYEEMRIKRPPRLVPGTDDLLEPDKGFAFNSGIALAA